MFNSDDYATSAWPLQDLDLGQNGIIDEVAMTHLSTDRWPNLQRLVLAASLLSPGGIVKLCQAGQPHLISLDLSTRPLSGVDVARLCQGH